LSALDKIKDAKVSPEVLITILLHEISNKLSDLSDLLNEIISYGESYSETVTADEKYRYLVIYPKASSIVTYNLDKENDVYLTINKDPRIELKPNILAPKEVLQFTFTGRVAEKVWYWTDKGKSAKLRITITR